jgi:hypothetical protein
MQSFLKEVVILKPAKIEVTLPGFGSCLLVWACNLSEDFYEASFALANLGYTQWLVKIYEGVVTPIKCSLYLTQQEFTKVLLAKQLKLEQTLLKENLFNTWIKEFKNADATKL